MRTKCLNFDIFYVFWFHISNWMSVTEKRLLFCLGLSPYSPRSSNRDGRRTVSQCQQSDPAEDAKEAKPHALPCRCCCCWWWPLIKRLLIYSPGDWTRLLDGQILLSGGFGSACWFIGWINVTLYGELMRKMMMELLVYTLIQIQIMFFSIISFTIIRNIHTNETHTHTHMIFIFIFYLNKYP